MGSSSVTCRVIRNSDDALDHFGYDNDLVVKVQPQRYESTKKIELNSNLPAILFSIIELSSF